MDLIAKSAPPVGEEWKFLIANIEGEVHSLTVEMYEANGGIIRLFPRGRKTMEVTVVLPQPGRTLVCVVSRNDTLKVVEQIFAHIDVGNPRPPPSHPIQSVPIMGVQKPSYGFRPPPDSGYARTAAPAHTANTSSPASPPASSAGDLSDLINSKTDALLNRLKRT